jgi:hypothetical protein
MALRLEFRILRFTSIDMVSWMVILCLPRDFNSLSIHLNWLKLRVSNAGCVRVKLEFGILRAGFFNTGTSSRVAAACLLRGQGGRKRRRRWNMILKLVVRWYNLTLRFLHCG